jgi:hypothetical protein
MLVINNVYVGLALGVTAHIKRNVPETKQIDLIFKV